MGVVTGVCLSATHTFGKVPQSAIRLLAGLGVEGDAHAGRTVKHRSRVKADPTQPNLRQVHLIHAELHDELLAAGFDKFMDEAAGQWGGMHRRARETAHVLGGRYLEVRYEDLVADPLPQLKRVLDHLGADSDAEVVRACVDAASFEKLSKGRSQGQEDSKSFFRKGIADDWKTQMTPAQIQRFDARSGGMLGELGYLG